LGRALAAGARRRGTATAWELGPVVDDGVAQAVASGAGLAVHSGDAVPAVRRPADGDVAHLVSANLRKTLRKARNRIAADGHAMGIEVSTEARAVEAALPQLAAAYRDRDHAHELPCVLDTERGLRTWQGRVRALAATGRLELSVLTLDGELAAYVLGLRDGARLGVLEGRFLTRFARYAPGRLLEADVLQRALADADVEELDWMTGVAPETLLAANHQEEVVLLRTDG
ncbi:GNAT family N-acetyltransferase, partial [Kineococcus sp. R8]|uniref:GNAT family N-acetyltransferase n=1 Tax=Kineococcus siccus TaxID=2696567 RepID=UPI0014135369